MKYVQNKTVSSHMIVKFMWFFTFFYAVLLNFWSKIVKKEQSQIIYRLGSPAKIYEQQDQQMIAKTFFQRLLLFLQSQYQEMTSK